MVAVPALGRAGPQRAPVEHQPLDAAGAPDLEPHHAVGGAPRLDLDAQRDRRAGVEPRERRLDRPAARRQAA